MTSAGVKIINEGKELLLYRNGDGYPSGLGVEILEHLDFDNFDLFKLISECGLMSVESFPDIVEYSYIINLNKRTFTIESLD